MAGSSSTSSPVSLIPMGPQVFINFRGKDVRKGFLSFLVPALKDENINVFTDEREERGKHLISLFETICESEIALVIFSERYTESEWCLDELAQIKECVDQNKLRVIPIFYKVNPTVVKYLKGEFGDKFRDLERKCKDGAEKAKKWSEALTTVSGTFAMYLPKDSEISDQDFVWSIVKEVRKVLPNNSNGRNGENDDNISIPARNLAITMPEAPNNEVVEVSPNLSSSNFTQLYLKSNLNQSPAGISCEIKICALIRPTANVFIINARELSIAWSNVSDYWTWFTLQNPKPNEPVVETAFMRQVCWLDIAGKFDTRNLLPMTRYEVVFVVMLVDTKCKWKKPVKLKLVLPSSRDKPQERSVYMLKQTFNQWTDIPVGEFTTSTENVGEISFGMYEHKSQLWKSGLYVKGVVIRPKH